MTAEPQFAGDAQSANGGPQIDGEPRTGPTAGVPIGPPDSGHWVLDLVVLAMDRAWAGDAAASAALSRVPEHIRADAEAWRERGQA